MQENHVNQPPSLSQLLRESYLAEARAQQRHSDMSRSDCSSSRRLVYGTLKGKAEESVGREDAPFPDLSAFLSQEELDESVNLACQAIGHKSHEERAEFKAIITPSNTPTATLPSTPSAKISDTPCVTPSVLSITNTPSVSPPVPYFNNTPCDTPAVPSFISAPSATPSATSYTNTPSVPPSVPSFTNTLSATSLANPVAAPSIQSAPEKKEGPPAIATFTAERQLHQPYMQDAVVRSNRASKEAPEEPNRPGRNTPFGPETQSKKEFLNKAADFIEELSSLFKANSTKRVRPRACKAHRSRSQNKSQPDGTAYSLNPEDRERPVLPLEADRTPSKPCNQPEAQAGSEHGHVDPAVEDSEVAEEQCDSAPPEVEQADSPAPVETPYSADPICEPPHFIQKLKSREVAEGSKVQLDCIVRGAPVPEVRWFCEGKELENSPDIQILTDGELHSLIIAEAFEEDTGRYSCFASNFYGTDSTSAEIYIEGVSSTDSEGEHHLEHVTQSHNASAQPSLSAASLASPVAPSEEVGGSPTALAPVFHEEHPGEGFSQAPGQVTTAAPPPPAADAALPAPEASVAPASIEAFEVEEESAPSPAEALSPVTPVVAQSVAQQEVSPQLSPTLPPVQSVTTLPLTTVVTSALPSQLTSTHVAEIQNYSDSYPQGLDGRPIMAAPVFTKSLQEVLASEGQLVVLECRVKGVPCPKVFWYREGTIIEDSPDFRILQKKPRPMTESEEICTLVIAEVFPEDSGMFTCTASNKYGTVSCIAALRVKGNGNNINHAKALGNFTMEFSQVPEPSPSDFRPSSLKPQAEASATNSIKPHSSTLRLDPLNSSTLRLDPLSTSTLRVDSISSTMLRPDLLSASLPNLDPVTLHGPRLESRSASTARLDPMFLSTLHQDLPGSGTIPRETRSSSEVPLYLNPFSDPTVARPQSASLTTIQEDGRPFPNLSEPAKGGILKSEASPNHKNKTSSVVPLADPPTASCLKSGVLVNHNEPRSSSRVGLRVHFRLPEDEEDEGDVHGDQSNEDWALSSANKEPPPVFAKPKLDPVQLQLLHNQVLMEQQQDTEPNSQNQSEAASWPRKTHHESPPPPAPLLPPAPALPRSPHPPASLSTAPAAILNSAPVARGNAPPAFLLTTTTSTPLAHPTAAPLAYSTSAPMAYTTSSAPLAYTAPAPFPHTSPAPLAYTTSTPIAYTTSSAPVAYTTSTPIAYNTSSAPVAYTTSTPIAYTTSSAPVAYTTLAPFPYTTNSAPIAYTTTSTPFPHTTSTPLANTASAVIAHPTVAPFQYTAPGHPTSTLPSPPQLKTVPTPLVTSPPPAPQLSTTPAQPLNPAHAAPFSMAPVSQMNTIHASYLNLSPLSLGKTQPILQFSALPAPRLSSAPAASMSAVPATLSKASPSLECTSPSPMLRTTHASLMNLAPISQSFNYARPKEFIAAQSLSPIRSPSPTESPVPLLHELAAELQASSSSPTVFPFSPPPRFFPTRVLASPTSPPGSVPSPTQVPYLNALFAPQSPPQSPTSSSSTPSPIQNPVAFLSSVLPCLPTSQPTNSMGLPRSAPVGHSQGALKKLPRSNRSLSDDNIRDNKDSLIHDIEKKFRFRDDTKSFGQQKLTYEGNTASRALGPHIPATVFNYDEEYRVSNFEQRLMSEIEFRLERTPVEESDDDVHHDEIPTGKCIAPIFDKKLKNFRAMEGVPVTFTCKVVGIPIPKVYWFKDGKQILRKNDHYKKIREGDGTCALHIERTTNDDDGNYTVMAANPQGRISCSGHLIIQTGPTRNRMTPIHSQRVRARVQEVEEGEQTQERFFQPHFLQAPGDMKAHEGGLCRLDCKVSGLPNPELMWLVNGRPIYPDFHHRMLVRENGIHSLVIDPLKQTDDGTYTCIASNKAGQSSFCLELRVVEKELKQAPHLVEKLQNTGVAEGSPVRLECRVVGMPPPVIFWKKDNDSIPHTKDRVSMHSDATGYVCLVIQPTKKEDAGWYTVSAKNEAGIVSCTSRLDIYAQWHQHIPSPMKKAPRTGSRYAALTGQGLDIKSAFPTADNTPTLFSSSPAEAKLESEEL